VLMKEKFKMPPQFNAVLANLKKLGSDVLVD
jgi:hypothetical protein